MTPLELEIFIHHTVCASKHNHVSVGTVPYVQGLNMLIENGLIEITDSEFSGYGPTEKGRFYLDYLCRVPFPVHKWVINDNQT